MYETEFTDEKLPTNKRYNLKAKIKLFRKNVVEDIGKEVQRYERRMVFLIPQESDECTRFLAAWLPDTLDQVSEMVAVIGSPVNSPCRMALKRGPDGQCERHYLIVMNVGVEEVIWKFLKEGTTLSLTVLGAHEDLEADYARESEGSYKKSEWDQAKYKPDENEASIKDKAEWSRAKYKKQKKDW